MYAPPSPLTSQPPASKDNAGAKKTERPLKSCFPLHQQLAAQRAPLVSDVIKAAFKVGWGEREGRGGYRANGGLFS